MPASLLLPILWLGIAPPAVPGPLGSAVECSIHRQVTVCPVSLGSAGTFMFIVDTGTRRTVLDVSLAARLGLQLQRDSLDSPAGAIAAKRAEIGPLRFGLTLVPGLTVSVCPLGSLSQLLGVKADGILGLDVLARAPFTIDFSTGRVWTVAARLSHETTLIGTDGGFAALVAQIGPARLRLVLDTGLDGIVLFADAASRSGSADAPVRWSGYGLGGAVRLESARLGCLWIADRCLDGEGARLIDNEVLRDDYRADGLIGPAAFDAAIVTMDFERGRYGWETAAGPSAATAPPERQSRPRSRPARPDR